MKTCVRSKLYIKAHSINHINIPSTTSTWTAQLTGLMRHTPISFDQILLVLKVKFIEGNGFIFFFFWASWPSAQGEERKPSHPGINSCRELWEQVYYPQQPSCDSQSQWSFSIIETWYCIMEKNKHKRPYFLQSGTFMFYYSNENDHMPHGSFRVEVLVPATQTTNLILNTSAMRFHFI